MTPPIRMVSVPVEPTREMVRAAVQNWPDIGDMWQAMLTAATVREEGGEVDDRLHSAISKLKDWVGLIQLRKNGGCVSGNPIVDCVNDLPAITRELEAAELEIEGAFERYEDAIATREESPADHHERNLSMTSAELIEQALAHPPLESPAEAWERECGWCDGRKTKQTPSTDFTIPCPYCKGTGKEALRAQSQDREEAHPAARVVRKGLSTGSLFYTEQGQNADLPDGTLLYTTPPAPEAEKLRILDVVGDYLIQQYGYSYGLHHPVDRKRILAALQQEGR